MFLLLLSFQTETLALVPTPVQAPSTLRRIPNISPLCFQALPFFRTDDGHAGKSRLTHRMARIKAFGHNSNLFSARVQNRDKTGIYGHLSDGLAPNTQTTAAASVYLEDVVRHALEGSNFEHQLQSDTSLRCWPYFSLNAETVETCVTRGNHSVLTVDDMVVYRDGALCSLRGVAEYSAAAKSWPTQLLEECPDAVCTIVRVICL